MSWAEGKGRKGGEIPRFGFAALGMACCQGTGMGPRIREDNGGEGAREGRPYGGRGVGRGMRVRRVDSGESRNDGWDRVK